MSLYLDCITDFQHVDDRGELVQLVHGGYSQINILKTKKGVTRGGHYHKISNEAFYVISGILEVTLEKERVKETVRFSEGDFFQIPPNTIHSMYFIEDSVMVAMYDTPVEKEDGSKDIYTP